MSIQQIIEAIQLEITQFEIRWKMTYQEFEKESIENENRFTFEMEKDYYVWSEKLALLTHLQANSF